MSGKFYITTTLPYVNAEPHIGFAKEIIFADAIARWHRLLQEEVFFNTGTDEHGQKVWQKAQEAGRDTQEYVDEYAKKFDRLKGALNLSYTNFIRTTDPKHRAAAQEFWKRCDASGDIYKKQYKIKYCVGCELEKTESELLDGHCPLHPGTNIEIREEENYFFRWSKYQDKLLDFYKSNSEFVVPAFRFNEIKAFVERGLEDFSISRLKKKMPWGVLVPGDDEHVMYVWFDALVNYVSTIAWPDEEYKKWWPVVQVAGKDNLRQQSAMWQAMLMSAGVEPSRQIVILGFITSEGQKMSKSAGNVVDPFKLVEEYGTDALRYFLLREITSFEDGDFTMERFRDAYNANLANGIGNLTSRIMKMAEEHLPDTPDLPEKSISEEFINFMDNYEVQKAADLVWQLIARVDERIQETQPFKLVKEDKEKAVEIIKELVVDLYTIGRMLNPLLPETSMKIKETVKANKKPEALFPRRD